jgi:hypothetical protein
MIHNQHAICRIRGSHMVVRKGSIFWDIAPCSPMKVNWRFGETCRLQLQAGRIIRARNQLCLPPTLTPVSCLVCSSTLKMEATCSSGTSVDFRRTTGAISQKTELFKLQYFHSMPNFLNSWHIDANYYYTWKTKKCVVLYIFYAYFPRVYKKNA